MDIRKLASNRGWFASDTELLRHGQRILLVGGNHRLPAAVRVSPLGQRAETRREDVLVEWIDAEPVLLAVRQIDTPYRGGALAWNGHELQVDSFSVREERDGLVTVGVGAGKRHSFAGLESALLSIGYVMV